MGLYRIYGDSIVGKGKAGKTWSMRYVYKSDHTFDTLDELPTRVKFIFLKALGKVLNPK